jgi:hypothetical protein
MATLIKLLLRIFFVALAFTYILPYIDGIRLSGDVMWMCALSIVFNLLFALVEWVLDVVVIGINISTLSIGILFSRFLEFASLLLAPSVALFGCAQILPHNCQLLNYYPTTIVAGITLGGIIFALQIAASRK